MTVFSSSSHSPAARRRAFSVVYAIELWERFGYYGMQAVLGIFMVEHLRMRDVDVNLMLGSFAVLTYGLPVMGGVIGDRLMGTRATMVLGALFLTAGYGLLAVSLERSMFFLLALALIALGNGLFKPNAGALVQRIYADDEAALDAAFTLYYMSINVGSTVSMLLMPWLQTHYGPSVAFIGCALGLLIGLVYYLWRAASLRPFFVGKAEPARLSWGKLALLITGLGAVCALSACILGNAVLAQLCVILAAVALIAVWAVLYRKAARHERPGLGLTYLLCLQTMLYQIFYQQMQTSLTLFALRAVSGEYRLGHVLLFRMTAGQFQALNPIWIMVLSPLLALAYSRCGAKGRDLSLPVKILSGYGLVCLSFGVWWWAASTAAGLVSPWIMAAGYGLLSFGELLTIGLGLTIIARYAPERLSGLLMGALYLLWGVSMYGGSLVANQAAVSVAAGETVSPHLYAPLFKELFEAAGALCVLLVCLQPIVRFLDRVHVNVTAQHRQSVLEADSL